MALVPCIAISTGYILLVMFLCELARKTVAPLNDGLVKTALNEAIAAADLCGVCFELIIGIEIKSGGKGFTISIRFHIPVADNYGLAAYGLYLFLATIWWSLHWGEKKRESKYKILHFEYYFRRCHRMSLQPF